MNIIELERATTYGAEGDDYARYVAPGVVLTGRFQHQRILTDFTINIIEGDINKWSHDAKGADGTMSALPTVISLHQVRAQPESIEVKAGDLIHTTRGVFKITDDRWLQNPLLVKVSG